MTVTAAPAPLSVLNLRFATKYQPAAGPLVAVEAVEVERHVWTQILGYHADGTRSVIFEGATIDGWKHLAGLLGVTR